MLGRCSKKAKQNALKCSTVYQIKSAKKYFNKCDSFYWEFSDLKNYIIHSQSGMLGKERLKP